MTFTRRDISELLEAHHLSPRRSLGQNFVVDPNTVRRIARLSGVGPGDRVVEIGAGFGSLTLALLETGASVTAVEVDPGLVRVLRSVVEPHGATVVAGDAMDLDWERVLGRDGPWSLVANLPYNVATPLLIRLLEEVPVLTRMRGMVQREAGERLASRPGDPQHGAVSVLVAYWASAALAARVPPTVFLPRPNVASVLVAITRRSAPAVEVDYDRFKTVVRAGFAHRRKMLRGALAGLIVADGFERAGIRPDARAEELDVAAWGRLAACLP